MRFKIIFLGFMLFSGLAYGQKQVAFGLSAGYNFPLKIAGMGLRAKVPLFERAFLVPEIQYFPKFNFIHELKAGLNAQYNILYFGRKPPNRRMAWKRPSLYLTVGAYYNNWLNYFPSTNARAKQHAFLPDSGGGVCVTSGTIQFFAEGKFNFLWNESMGMLGIYLYTDRLFKFGSQKCPAY